MDDASDSSNRSQSDKARSFFGTECPVQPSATELPVLDVGRNTQGCQFRDFGQPDSSSSGIDILALYKENRPGIVQLKIDGHKDKDGQASPVPENWGGTAFMVAKEANSCLAITDNHVVNGVPNVNGIADKRTAVTISGDSFDVKVIAADKSQDLALIELATGDKTTAVCKPLEIVDSKMDKANVPAVAIGQAYTSGGFFVAEGTFDGIEKRDNAKAAPPPLPEENGARDVQLLTMHVRPGVSGAPAFDKDGRVAGVIDIGGRLGFAISTPITKQTIIDLKAKK
ncbi:hypothetical protein BH11CYA1_BH11CYA1_23860 [soil metagenome]